MTARDLWAVIRLGEAENTAPRPAILPAFQLH